MNKTLIALSLVTVLGLNLTASAVSNGYLEKNYFITSEGNIANNSNDYNDIKNVKVYKTVATFDIGLDNYAYDAENEILRINDTGYIEFKTKVEYLNPVLGITEEQALNDEKQRILDNLMLLQSNDGSKTRSIDVSNYIPMNAPYIKTVDFSKQIVEVYGELGDILSSVSFITGGASLIKAIPYSVIIGAVSTTTGMAEHLISKTKGYVCGKWYYTQHRTASKYKVVASTQYGYRYAQSGINLSVKIGNKTYYPIATSNSMGAWWVAQKPW